MDTLKIKPHPIPWIGSFCIYNPKSQRCGNMSHCRVSFHWGFKSHHTHIGLRTSIESANNDWKNFLSLIESKLKLEVKSIVYNGDAGVCVGNISITKLSPFWTKNPTNRSLITLLYRCGLNYYKGDFNEAINKYKLTSQCKLAINHFLEGNTKPIYRTLNKKDYEGYGGFVAQFEGCSQNELNKMLVKE